MKLEPRLPDSVDESVWYVMVAMVGALFIGGCFLFFAIQVVPPGTAPAPRSAAVPKETAAKPGTGTGSTAGTAPAKEARAAADAEAASAAPPASARARIVADERTRNAARLAGLLWAFACCAVGAFLGFIFGIPRSLSSDTARTTVAAPSRPAESAAARAAALAAAEKEEAAQHAEGIGKQVAEAEAGLARLRTAAGAGADSDPQVKAASEALAVLRENKRKADAGLAEKAGAAQKAEALVKKEQGALPSAAAAAGTGRLEPVHTRAPSTAVNTNLEQISDWLTKIIVGVSLVNSERVGQAMLGIATEMASSFGGPGSRSLALAILTYFSVIGLLGGYLLTRLFLQRAFEALGAGNQAGAQAG